MIAKAILSPAFPLACLLFLPGCQTDKDASAIASVEIQGKTYGQVRLTVIEVFEETGFTRQWTDPSMMTFDRSGSKASNLLYGSWEPNSVGDRAKIRMEAAGPDTFMVLCEAYRVTNQGDSIFEEEKRLGKSGASKYGTLLQEVKHRLDTLPPGY